MTATDDLIPTKETPGPFDGIESLKPGEPVFPLQGGDPLSAELVRIWAQLARARTGLKAGADIAAVHFSKLVGVAIRDPARKKKHVELLERATEAEAISWEMDAYRKGEKAVERSTESYSGHKESEESRAEADHRRKLYDLSQQLEEAKYHANETAMALDAAGEFPDQAKVIRQAIAKLDSAADAIRPKRFRLA